MTSNAALQDEPAPIVACTISRDVQNFDLLIEDMENVCGENWGDLSLQDASVFFDQPEADTLEFVVLAVDQDDEDEIDLIADLIKRATAQKIAVLIVAEEVSPIVLHKLLKIGAEEFIPYPLPDGALDDAIARMRKRVEDAKMLATNLANNLKATGDRDGVVIPIHGLAGGTGSTTFAVNLAWELANVEMVMKIFASAYWTSIFNSEQLPHTWICPVARLYLSFCKTPAPSTRTVSCRLCCRSMKRCTS